MRQIIRDGVAARNGRNVDQKLREHQIELPLDLHAKITLLPNRVTLLEHMPSGGCVAEIGVAAGEFSEQILTTCRPQQLYLIDWWKESSEATVRDRFAEQIDSGTVSLLTGVSWECTATLADNTLDWCYIDAGHDYESVRRDLESVANKVKPGGFICGHDYTRWLGNTRMGVVEAVNEFCNSSPYHFRFLTNQANRCLSYGLQRCE